MQKRSFEEELKSRVEQFEPAVKEGLWDAVEAQLYPEKSRKRFIWVWFSAAAIIAGAAVLYVMHDNKSMPADRGAVYTNADEPKAETPSVLSDEGNNSPIQSVESEKSQVVNTMTSQSEVTVPLSYSRTRSVKNRNVQEMFPVREQYSKHDENVLTDNENTLTDVITGTIAETENPSETSVETTISIDNTIIRDTVPAVVQAMVPAKDTTVKSAVVNNPLLPRNKTSHYIGLLFTPLMSQSHVSIDEAYASSEPYQSDFRKRKAEDRRLAGYGAGFTWNMTKGRHQISSGLQYVSMGYRVFVKDTSIDLLKGASVVSNNKSFVLDQEDSFYLIGSEETTGGGYVSNRSHYITIPVSYGYTLLSKHGLSVAVTATVSYNFMLAYRGILYQQTSGLYVNSRVATENHLQKNVFMASAGFDLGYELPGKNSMLFIRPQYGTSLTSLENTPVKTQHRYWMLGLGMKWKLK